MFLRILRLNHQPFSTKRSGDRLAFSLDITRSEPSKQILSQMSLIAGPIGADEHGVRCWSSQDRYEGDGQIPSRIGQVLIMTKFANFVLL